MKLFIKQFDDKDTDISEEDGVSDSVSDPDPRQRPSTKFITAPGDKSSILFGQKRKAYPGLLIVCISYMLLIAESFLPNLTNIFRMLVKIGKNDRPND